MHTEFLSFRSSLIHYSSWGTGPELCIGLHGYGESSDSFAFLSRALPIAQYSFIAPDLPFHGRTDWKEALVFSVDDLIEIIDGILSAIGRKNERFKLIGFSLGGRVALCLVQKIPGRISKLILLAPDGLNRNAWYWLATQNRPGNQLFRLTVLHPGWLFALLKMGKLLRIIHPEFYKFADYYIQDQPHREDLYHRWMVLRKFKPDLSAIKSCIAANRIRVELLLGHMDRLMPPGKGEIFKKGIEEYCGITLQPGGHQLLQERNAATIISMLKD